MVGKSGAGDAPPPGKRQEAIDIFYESFRIAISYLTIIRAPDDMSAWKPPYLAISHQPCSTNNKQQTTNNQPLKYFF
jgi:hypothetical protein